MNEALMVIILHLCRAEGFDSASEDILVCEEHYINCIIKYKVDKPGTWDIKDVERCTKGNSNGNSKSSN